MKANEFHNIIEGDPKATLSFYLSCLQDADPEARAIAAARLAALGSAAQQAIPALVTATNDPHPAVRSAAIHALAKVKGQDKNRAQRPPEITIITHSEVSAIAFAREPSTVLSVSQNLLVERWDSSKGMKMDAFKTGRWFWPLLRRERHLESAAFHPDGRHILLGLDDRTARLWSINDRREMCCFNTSSKKVRAVTISDDGHCVLTASGEMVELWDATNGKLLQRLSPKTRYQGSGRNQSYTICADVYSIAMSPDLQYVAAAAQDTIRLWDVKSGKEVCNLFTEYGTGSWSVCFSPDGRYLLTGSTENYNYSARIWRVATGEQVGMFVGHHSLVRHVAFSPSGKVILTSADKTRLWTIDMQLIHEFRSSAKAAAFSRDGRHLVLAFQEEMVISEICA